MQCEADRRSVGLQKGKEKESCRNCPRALADSPPTAVVLSAGLSKESKLEGPVKNMRNSAENSLNLAAQSRDPVVHVEKSRGKAEMVRPTLSLSLSFCSCSRRKAFNGAEEIAREEQNGMRQIERPKSRTKEGKINNEKRSLYEA